MKIENFPGHLPYPPELPKGYKYVYRGLGWNGRNVCYITSIKDSQIWDKPDINSRCNTWGSENCHYLEIVKENNGDITVGEFMRKVEEAKKLIGETIISKKSLKFVVKKVEAVIFPSQIEKYTCACREFFKENGYCIVMDGDHYAVPFEECEVVSIIEVELNSKYTAIIEDGKVKVGCQEFTFEKIKELAEKVKEAEKLS